MNRAWFVPVLVLLVAGVAQANVELTAEATTEVKTITETGEEVVRFVPAVKVVPGDEVVYTIRYANKGTEPAADVVITNPIPEHMVFTQVVESPQTAVVSMSADGGSEYGSPGDLSVKDAGGELRPATASDFTHVRWVFQEPLAAGAEGSVSFRAQLQ
jgi:uncharacterized repeat protein (TIGR01451 family)